MSRRPQDGIGGYLLCAAMLGGGIWAHIHYSSLSRACQLAESFGYRGYRNCNLATTVAPLSIPIAVVGGVGLAVLILIGIITRLAESPGDKNRDIAIRAASSAVRGQATRTCCNDACTQFGLPTDTETCEHCEETTIPVPAKGHAGRSPTVMLAPAPLRQVTPDSRQCVNVKCDEAGLATTSAACPACDSETIPWE